ncbi:hypothetical protein L917_09946 [Plasmopara halstedii]|uniref:Phosphatidate cytidylyltransferase n=1 Tax=Plasmopara halstedii TaxID=4781 RepID=A0A0P1B7S8_PLAHL|nr:hypothetical protein L917_09946 [Plasmopara halstedii]CEG50439.1 hypothetical protein L917_09946 [Plasmopara halstedii]|eukprot:XP_024586808.1 hypothetical protein L917_09946 [Plasmopara halstedii]
MSTSHGHFTHSAAPTVLFDSHEDDVSMATTRSNQMTASFRILTRSRAATTSSKSQATEVLKGRTNMTAAVDIFCEDPIITEKYQVIRVSEQRHDDVPTPQNIKSAKKIMPEDHALPAESANPFSPISNSGMNHSQTLTTQELMKEKVDEDEKEDQDHQQEMTTSEHQDRSQSPKQSMFGINCWSCCGHSYPNWVLRLCTGLVLVPTIVCGLLFWPIVAASMLTTILMSICTYEHAWLSHRIHKQLLTTYQWYEGSEGSPEAENACIESTRSNASAVCGYVKSEDRDLNHTYFSTAFTQSMPSIPTGTMICSDDGNMTFMNANDKDSFADPVAEAEAMTCSHPPSAIHYLDFEASRGILLETANAVFCGNLWLARIVIAVLCTISWVIVSTVLLPLMAFPVINIPDDLASATFYFWVVNFVAALCVVNCPTISCAISIVIQKAAYEVLLFNTLNCPLVASMECSASPLTSIQTLLLGAMAIILVHALTAHGPANLVVAVTLDLLGYVYVAGALGLLVSMIDPSDSSDTWATIWLGMLIAMWMAQFAGYVCDVIMYRLQLPHIKLLPSHIVVTLNVEASLCGMVVGSLTFVVGGFALNAPGGVVPKILFSIAGVMMAQFGQMLLLLIKKAASVRWSGRLMPGFGGLLDASHAMLFASVVFVKYYFHVVAQATDNMVESGSISMEL